MRFCFMSCRRLITAAVCGLAGSAVFAAEPPLLAEPVSGTIANPYGLAALWAQGDVVARGTLIVLIFMSMASWYVLLAKLVEQHRMFRQAKSASRRFWPAASVAEGLGALAGDNPFRVIAAAGQNSVEHHDGMAQELVDLNTWVSMSIQRAVSEHVARLQGGVSVLATVGSTAPFVGLFGTVWGIYHALTEIGIAGQASIDKVAGPVGEALIMTAMGLAVAVPAVLGYNWLVRRNRVLIDTLRAFGSDIHSVLLGGRASRPERSSRVASAVE
jgi:biopolymer transport protein ExbB